MHGRSRMTIDPRIPTMPGRSTSGFHPPDRHRVHQAQTAVGCSTSHIKGELHPAKNHLRGGHRHHMRTFLHVDDRFKLTNLISWRGAGRGVRWCMVLLLQCF